MLLTVFSKLFLKAGLGKMFLYSHCHLFVCVDSTLKHHSRLTNEIKNNLLKIVNVCVHTYMHTCGGQGRISGVILRFCVHLL